jgi:hypothetical protein
MSKVYLAVVDGMDGGQVMGVFSSEHLAKTHVRNYNQKQNNKRKKDAREYELKYGLKYIPSVHNLVVETWELDKAKEMV